MLHIIADFFKTWLMKITAISLQLARTRVFMTLNSPTITEKREKRERGPERERERAKNKQQSFVFISWTFDKQGETLLV